MFKKHIWAWWSWIHEDRYCRHLTKSCWCNHKDFSVLIPGMGLFKIYLYWPAWGLWESSHRISVHVDLQDNKCHYTEYFMYSTWVLVLLDFQLHFIWIRTVQRKLMRWIISSTCFPHIVSFVVTWKHSAEKRTVQQIWSQSGNNTGLPSSPVAVQCIFEKDGKIAPMCFSKQRDSSPDVCAWCVGDRIIKRNHIYKYYWRKI